MRFFLPLCLFALAGCLEVRAELRTEVQADKSGLRSVELQMTETDGGIVTDEQRSMFPWSPSDSRWTREGTLFRSTNSVADLSTAPHPLQLHNSTSGEKSKPSVLVTTQDWGIFKSYQYKETFRDVVTPEGIQKALREITDECTYLTSLVLRKLIGEGFEDSRLAERFSSDLKMAAFELGQHIWKSWTLDAPDDVKEKRMILNSARVLSSYGFSFNQEDVQSVANGKEDPGSIISLQEDIVRFMLKEVQLDAESQTEIEKWRALLFDGTFGQEFERQGSIRHGSAEEFQEWFEKTFARVQGLFGPGIFKELDFEVVLAVKLPGSILKTNGFLSQDGSTFLSFSGASAYPNGRSLESESIVWNPIAAAIPLNGFPMDHKSAIRFMRIFRLPNSSAPDHALVSIVRQCAEQASWKPLSLALSKSGPPKRNEQMLQWEAPILNEAQKGKLRRFQAWMKFDE
ncbi:MAG: hypothetical protein QGH51_10020 [Planctomycetota bacterium]|nr:hypothetical protein [Planctomycetota bacterium]